MVFVKAMASYKYICGIFLLWLFKCVTPSTPHICVLIIKGIRSQNQLKVCKTHLNKSISKG